MDKSSNDKPELGGVPPLLPGTQPPVISGVASGSAGPVAQLPPKIPGKTSSMREGISILLSLFLVLFLADAVVSLLDDSLIVFFGVNTLTAVRGMLFFFVLLMAIGIYGLMGLTPMIPKRWFLPVTLFIPFAALVAIPFSIYFYPRTQQVAWFVSLFQVLLGLGMLYWIRGSLKFRWPLVTEKQLEGRRFSWRNLSLFTVTNLFVLLPAVIAYLALCAALAVDHFSEGFMALRPSGFKVQVRKYVDAEGRTIQLFPMMHIGDADFYQKLSQSFPANSIILMEGVTDKNNLLTNKVSYKRVASSLGLADQSEEFEPSQGEVVMADVDVAQFAPQTIDLLNRVMRFNAKGPTAESLMELMQNPPQPGFEEQFFGNILRKRNQHLLGEIKAHLSQTDNIIVPWGAAHMPEIAREIEKAGFRLQETEEFVVVRFWKRAKR